MENKKISNRITLNTKRAISGYIFCMPFIIGFILFFLTPLMRSIVFSFSKIYPSESGMIIEFIGFNNYYTALQVDPEFLKTISDSLIEMIYTFPAVMLYSFFIATILNQKFTGRLIARVIFFLPVVLTSGVIYFLQNDLINSTAIQAISGSNDSFEDTLDLTSLIMEYLHIGSNFLGNIVAVSVNRIYFITVSSGVQILIFLAGLQTIHPSIYEASSIEGATSWENFWKITLPMISPMILVNAIYTIIDSMSGLSNSIIHRIFRVTFNNSDYGLSAAMSWIYLVIMIVILVIVIFIINKMVFYEND